MRYRYEWDPAKAIANHRKHSVSFDEASTAFSDPLSFTAYDHDQHGDEERWILLGMTAEERLVVVVHTFREDISSD